MNIIDKVNKNNPHVITLIKNAFSQNKLAHAFIFSAKKGYKIIDEPLLLINSIIENEITNKNHSQYPDLEIIDGSNNLIKKEFVIKAINKMEQTPLDVRGYRILLIKNIENSNKQSLNSLLKFIEEPHHKTYIIITTNNLANVLSTIKSRSQIINLKNPSKQSIIDAIDYVKSPYSNIIALISNSLQEAKDLAKENKNIDLLKEIINIFNESADNKNKFIIELNKILNKKNYKLVIPTLNLIINDILKYQYNEEIITNLKNVLNKYKNINHHNILKALNSFILVIKNNGNFELAKTKLLLEIEDNF